MQNNAVKNVVSDNPTRGRPSRASGGFGSETVSLAGSECYEDREGPGGGDAGTTAADPSSVFTPNGFHAAANAANNDDIGIDNAANAANASITPASALSAGGLRVSGDEWAAAAADEWAQVSGAGGARVSSPVAATATTIFASGAGGAPGAVWANSQAGAGAGAPDQSLLNPNVVDTVGSWTGQVESS